MASSKSNLELFKFDQFGYNIIEWYYLLYFPCPSIVRFSLQLYSEWIFFNMGVFTGSSVFPVIFALMWSRCTSWGVISGIVGGFCAGIPTWIYLASMQENGLDEFVESSCEYFIYLRYFKLPPYFLVTKACPKLLINFYHKPFICTNGRSRTMIKRILLCKTHSMKISFNFPDVVGF